MEFDSDHRGTIVEESYDTGRARADARWRRRQNYHCFVECVRTTRRISSAWDPWTTNPWTTNGGGGLLWRSGSCTVSRMTLDQYFTKDLSVKVAEVHEKFQPLLLCWVCCPQKGVMQSTVGILIQTMGEEHGPPLSRNIDSTVSFFRGRTLLVGS